MYFLNFEGNCIEWENGYILNYTNWTCDKIVDEKYLNCKSIDVDSNKCADCKDGYYFDEKQKKML